MKLEEKIIAGQNGTPLKKVLNFDEETYSVVTRPEYFPIQIKVPKKYIYERRNTGGHPFFVDDNQHLWGASGTSIYKVDLASNESELFKNMTTVNDSIKSVESVIKTKEDSDGNYNILVSVTIEAGNSGGQLYVSSDKGVTWAKTLDANDFGLKSLFRHSNVWYHSSGNREYIVVGSYGNNNAEDESANNKVWISKDKGMTWQVIYEPPLVVSGVNNHIHSLCVQPNNGWVWITHGDGGNRGIVYSHDALYATDPTITILSEGGFKVGGWQPSAVVTTGLGAHFGTDTGGGLPNGILSYDIPDRTMIDKLGYRYQALHDDELVHISRRGAQIDFTEAYIVMQCATKPETKIMATGDCGLSWHEVMSLPFGAFEKGMTNPDKDGFVYGPNSRFKVSEWETVTKWVKGRFADKVGYI